MTKPARLRAAPDPFVPDWGERGALRQSVGETGRVHLDRDLPFLLLHRGTGDGNSLARRIALNSPCYLVWDEADDHDALLALGAVVGRLVDKAGSLLVIALADDEQAEVAADSPDLPPFRACLRADSDGPTGSAASVLAKALGGIEIDLRRCKVDRSDFAPLLPDRFDRLLDGQDRVARMALVLPPIHRRPDEGIYPGVADAMTTAGVDAILRAACAFVDKGTGRAPKHYRAFGRSAYLAAALKADRRIDEVARSFDFLLSISPIDTARAMDRFFADGADRPPKFHYRPLTVDPDLAKRALYDIDLSSLEDPLLERLLGEKRRELDAQLTMLATRNTPAFRPASMFLYGAVDAPLLADALTVLGSTATDTPRGPTVGAHEIAGAAQDLIDRYRTLGPFDARVCIRDDVAGLMVSGNQLMIGSDSVMPERRLVPLLAHEVSIHLLTHFNGATQGLGIFRSGLAGYEGVQEGLGVFAEWAVGGLTRTRLRLIAGRVVAVDAMLRGATFIDCWRLLTKDHGFTRRGAFGITARVYRSGGLAKDAIYLQGFRAVIDLVGDGARLDPFWMGKIAVGHRPAIEELLQRGLAQPPRFIPEFLDDPDVRDRIARLREDGALNNMLSGVQDQ